jgi:hypothetical protein
VWRTCIQSTHKLISHHPMSIIPVRCRNINISSPPSVSCTGSDIQHCSEQARTETYPSYQVILTSARHLGLSRSHHCRSQCISRSPSLNIQCMYMGWAISHVFLELLKVFLLLCELLLKIQKLLLLTHPNGIILISLLTLREGIPIC